MEVVAATVVDVVEVVVVVVVVVPELDLLQPAATIAIVATSTMPEVLVVGSVVEVVGAGGLGLPQANAGAPLAAREPAVIATVATNVPPAANQLWRPRR